MSLPGRLVTVDGIRLFVHRAGPSGGVPVVLVHGFMMSHYAWKKVIPGLVAAGHEVIAIDLPGFGESDRPEPAAYRYDPVAFSDTLLAVLDVLGVKRFVIAGISMGGAVALTTAARHPDRVSELILLDALCYRPEMPPEARLVRAPGIGLGLMRAMSTQAMIRYVLRRDIYLNPDTATKDLVDYVWERVNRPGGVEAAHACMRFIHDPGLVERSLGGVRAPALVIWGESDRLFPLAHARRIAGALPGSRLEIVPACGHAPPEERPEAVSEAMTSFLGARRAGRRVA